MLSRAAGRGDSVCRQGLLPPLAEPSPGSLGLGGCLLSPGPWEVRPRPGPKPTRGPPHVSHPGTRTPHPHAWAPPTWAPHFLTHAALGAMLGRRAAGAALASKRRSGSARVNDHRTCAHRTTLPSQPGRCGVPGPGAAHPQAAPRVELGILGGAGRCSGAGCWVVLGVWGLRVLAGLRGLGGARRRVKRHRGRPDPVGTASGLRPERPQATWAAMSSRQRACGCGSRRTFEDPPREAPSP